LASQVDVTGKHQKAPGLEYLGGGGDHFGTRRAYMLQDAYTYGDVKRPGGVRQPGQAGLGELNRQAGQLRRFPIPFGEPEGAVAITAVDVEAGRRQQERKERDARTDIQQASSRRADICPCVREFPLAAEVRERIPGYGKAGVPQRPGQREELSLKGFHGPDDLAVAAGMKVADQCEAIAV